jgi:hypothetical protein
MPPLLFPLNRLHLNFSGTPAKRKGVGPSLRGMRPLPGTPVLLIAGVTRDKDGAALGGCTCTLFRVENLEGVDCFKQREVAISDGSGAFSFVVGLGTQWRVTTDLDGVPVRAGLTLKTVSPPGADVYLRDSTTADVAGPGGGPPSRMTVTAGRPTRRR